MELIPAPLCWSSCSCEFGSKGADSEQELARIRGNERTDHGPHLAAPEPAWCRRYCNGKSTV